jgi:hypothetical protein
MKSTTTIMQLRMTAMMHTMLMQLITQTTARMKVAGALPCHSFF